MSRWWGVAALALSIGLNAGLVVAVLQQRWQQPAVVLAGQAEVAEPAIDGWSVARPYPAATEEEGPFGAAPPPSPGASGSGAGAGAPADTAPPFVTADRGTGGGASGEVGGPAGGRPDGAQPPPAARVPVVLPEVGERAERAGEAPLELAWADEQGGSLPGGRPGGQPPPRAAGPPQARLEEVAERLGVPAADRPRFFAIQRRFFTATHEQRLRLDSVRRELRGELVSPQPDRARIDWLLRQSAELQVGLERALVDHVFAAREVLDGEAELRYLHLLSRLGPGGPGAGGPGGRGPGAGAAPPPWRRPPGGERPRRPGDRLPRRFGGAGGGWEPSGTPPPR